MGYKADTSLGFLENEVQPQAKLQEAVGNKYFLTTGRDYPFCRKWNCSPNGYCILIVLFFWLEQVYRVSVDLAKPAYAEDWVQGRLKASLYSPNGVIRADLTPAETKLAHGTTYTTVVANPVDLGRYFFSGCGKSSLKSNYFSGEYKKSGVKLDLWYERARAENTLFVLVQWSSLR